MAKNPFGNKPAASESESESEESSSDSDSSSSESGDEGKDNPLAAWAKKKQGG